MTSEPLHNYSAHPLPWFARVLERLPAHPRRKAFSVIKHLRLLWYRMMSAGRRFDLGGRSFAYLLHSNNVSWQGASERIVEVPIALAALETATNGRVLEVGNVLCNYSGHRHAVVDKYERAPGVLNVDVIEYEPDDRFDLIISISTLEHVGWDETPKDPEKIFRAIDRLRRCLAPGGKLIATIPVGWNPPLDAILRGNRLHASDAWALQRRGTPLWPEWSEVLPALALEARYGDPHPYANAVLVLQWGPGAG